MQAAVVCAAFVLLGPQVAQRGVKSEEPATGA